MSHRVLHDFRVIAQLQLLHDPVFVEGHGARGEVKNGSRLLHRFSLRQQLQHFDLPICESRPDWRRPGELRSPVPDERTQLRREVELAVHGLLNRSHELGCGRRFRLITGRSLPERLFHKIGIYVYGDVHDLEVGKPAADPARSFEPI